MKKNLFSLDKGLSVQELESRHELSLILPSDNTEATARNDETVCRCDDEDCFGQDENGGISNGPSGGGPSGGGPHPL